VDTRPCWRITSGKIFRRRSGGGGVNLLLDSPDEIGLPGDPEFRSALVAYLEWGSRLALMNLKLPAETAADPATPVPHWSWGVPSGPCEPEQESRVSAAQRVLARTLLSLV
jgi:hypothetical protein